MLRGLFRGRPRRHAAFHRQHRHLLGLAQQRHGEDVGVGLLDAAVPRHQDVAADRFRHFRRHDQHRTPALEQRGLERRHARVLRRASRAAEHDQIEDPAVAAEEGIVGGVRHRPAKGQGGRFLHPRRHLMGLHEALERLARLLGGLGVEGAGERQARDRLQRHIGPRHGPDGKPFQVAVEALRHQPGGFQHRRHGVVVFGRNQDGLHGVAPLSRHVLRQFSPIVANSKRDAAPATSLADAAPDATPRPTRCVRSRPS